ncbi:MAG: pentapeptide repeat-containing protein [Bacteroidales bacterium]
MSETKKIGKKIAEARKKANISQANLAERLFISPQAVGKWERGESMPDILTLNRLAEILGVDFNYFSENFPSVISEMDVNKPLIKKTSELPAEKQVKIPGWDMSLGNWKDADFSGLKNLYEKFNSSNMQHCRFNGSDLSGLILKSNNIEECDFSDCNISNSHIQTSNLNRNIFKNSLLKGSDFSESNIEKCDFSGAKLNETVFLKSFLYGCNLSDTDFAGAEIKMGGITGQKSKDVTQNTIINTVWNRTSFIETHIADVVFTGTFEDCCFENCKFTRVVFKEVTFINTFFKNNKNLKRVRFIDCKADRMSFEFLKQGNADTSQLMQ